MGILWMSSSREDYINKVTYSTNAFLAGKNVLLIAPKYFGYELAISKAIVAAGGNSVYIDERPGNDFISKGLVRINANLLRAKIKNYYSNQLSTLTDISSFDYIIVISPEALNAEMIKKMRLRFPKAICVLYMWDSIRNKTGTNNAELLPYFDRIFSFDRTDCQYYSNLVFRPLFYLNEYADSDFAISRYEYDLTFIGTMHSDRYEICHKLRQQAIDGGLTVFYYLYLHDKRLYWYYLFTNPSMRGGSICDFSFTPMSPSEIKDKIWSSKVVLDIQHPGQTGLTMRTIEVLGAKRKLITTNKAIYQYDFYEKDNIYWLNRDLIDLPFEWLEKPYKALPDTIYKNYSIKKWLADILGC